MSRYTALDPDCGSVDLGPHATAYAALDYYLSAYYPTRRPVTGTSLRGGGTLVVHVLERGQSKGFDLRIVADNRGRA